MNKAWALSTLFLPGLASAQIQLGDYFSQETGVDLNSSPYYRFDVKDRSTPGSQLSATHISTTTGKQIASAGAGANAVVAESFISATGSASYQVDLGRDVGVSAMAWAGVNFSFEVTTPTRYLYDFTAQTNSIGGRTSANAIFGGTETYFSLSSFVPSIHESGIVWLGPGTTYNFNVLISNDAQWAPGSELPSFDGSYAFSLVESPVPEPISLLGLGLPCFGMIVRRRQRRNLTGLTRGPNAGNTQSK